jgi:hypothetical protein
VFNVGRSAISAWVPYRGAMAARANIGKTEIRLTKGLPPETCAVSGGMKP